MSQGLHNSQSKKNNNPWFNLKKISSTLVVVFLLGSVFFVNVKVARALDPPTTAAVIFGTIKRAAKDVYDFAKDKMDTVIGRAASKAFQVTLSRALNKVAYDYATALGSGNWGQGPLFQAKKWDTYFADVADEAAGSFIEGFANNYSAEKAAGMAEVGKEESANYDEQKGCNDFCQTQGDLKEKVDPSCEDQLCSPSDPPGCLEEYCQTTTFTMAKCQDYCQKNYQATKKTIDARKTAISHTPIATCQPSSINVKLRIALGLAQVSKPAAPNCTATQMISKWKTAADQYAAWRDPNYLDKIGLTFDPISNDLGIYTTLKSDLLTQQQNKKASENLSALNTEGYTDKRNIAGNLISIPNKSKLDTAASGQMYVDNFGKYTGDAFIDAANIFINQAALTAFNKLMAEMGNKVKPISPPPDNDNQPKTTGCNPLTDPGCAPANYGQGNVQEAASSLIKPSFATQADYNILASLSACADPKNPGPTECVIDERFLQAITEKKTVAEALTAGFLNKNWLVSADAQDANSYNTRNISVLRKYRILPVGWEEAANKSEQLKKKATIMDLVSCFDPNDTYNEFGAEFDVRDQAWCEGLVDPNWVLKSPLGYCRKEGFGNQIQSLQIISGQAGQGTLPDTPSSLTVSRTDAYCADPQTCIKEKADGTCDAYGYCNAEKRTWAFGNDSCDPVYNTCQSFSKSDGSSMAYLKNTLDYGNCNADNAGCQAFSWTGLYNKTSGQVAWDATRKIFLNNNAGVCSANEEGCTGLLRVKPSWGANLIMNTNFENDALGNATSTDCSGSQNPSGGLLNNWYFESSAASNGANACNAEIIDLSGFGGSTSNKGLKLSKASSDIGLYSVLEHSLLPDGFSFLPDQSYTLSADVYFVTGSKVSLWMGLDSNPTTEPTVGFVSTDVKDSWQHLSFVKTASDGINDPEFAIKGTADANGIEFYIKNLKFELSDYDTGYKLYGAYLIYEKLLPPYLEAACYTNSASGVKDYTIKPGAPSICASFARKCNKNEAGCELYSSLDGFSVPAQTTPADYCPGECIGYDTYVSKQTYFNSPYAENLIPRTAQTCSAMSAGCSEFTNLDAVASGGEQREYYSFLKQCIKPDTSCGDFYVWGNGSGAGYQLEALSLKADTSGSSPDSSHPFVVDGNSSACSEAIFNALPSDANYNPDCRQFYNKAGVASYQLISKTVTCSDDCKTFRMTNKNIDSKITSENNCNNPPDQTSRSWDGVNNVCYSCQNGGTWDGNQKACTYKAIPSEGTKCLAKENNCREFNGNLGNNLRLIKADDFESGIVSWVTTVATAILSTDSNNKDGHSLSVSSGGAIDLGIGNNVKTGGSYVIKFLAKTATATPLTISFNNVPTNSTSVFGPANQESLTVKGDNEWHVYQVNLGSLYHEVTAAEILRFESTGAYKVDNVILQEISDKYYLIAQSSVIPDICYYDMLDKYQGADYNLGCSAYSDRNNVQHNLHQFSKLCQDSAVGCEMMVNTQNYGPYSSKLFNDTNLNGVCDANEPDCVKVAQDNITYAVFDSSKQCNNADQGCSRLGSAQKQGLNWYFNDVYRLNNPDTYAKSLCQEASVGCSSWQDSNGSSNYFKDPGLNTCVYRNGGLGNGAKAWFMVASNKCDLNDDGQIKNVAGNNGNETGGPICLSDQNCSGGHKCIIDNNDYDCPTSYLKTIGYGGVNNQIATPNGAAGLCEAPASGCSEYIDPVSRFSNNLVFNPNYEDLNGDGKIGDGWKNGSFKTVVLSANQQTVSILAGKLYKFQFSDEEKNGVKKYFNFECVNNFRILGNNNNFGDPTIKFDAVSNNPYFILSPINNTCLLSGGDKIRTFELREAIISYQKQSELDKKSCNGVVNFDNGCVLFNERGQNGASGLTNLNGAWNAAVSLDKNSPATCSAIATTSADLCGGAGGTNCNTKTDIPYNNCNANQLIKVRPDRTCGAWLDCSSYSVDPQTKEKTCYAISQCDRLNDQKECASFVKAAPTATSTLKFNLATDKNATGYSLLNNYYLPNMKEVGSDIGWHVDFETKATPLSCVRKDGSDKACVFDKNINADSIVSEPTNSPTDYPAHGQGYLKVLSSYIISPMASSACIPVIKDTDYYLNYLVNTKNSNANAQVTVTTCGSNPDVIVSSTVSAVSGWERKVIKIHNPNADKNVGIKIQLSSDSTDVADRYVYFDDLNIEPALKINSTGDDSKDYVAKECRLYPGADSLTCLSQGANVISDGLFGYCLEHDKGNKNVCLMWYPVDNIGAGINRNNKISGYKGIFPLNYCTEMNGNFSLLEDRKTTFMGCNNDLYAGGGRDWWYECWMNTSDGFQDNGLSGDDTKFWISPNSPAAKEVGAFTRQCNVNSDSHGGWAWGMLNNYHPPTMNAKENVLLRGPGFDSSVSTTTIMETIAKYCPVYKSGNATTSDYWLFRALTGEGQGATANPTSKFYNFCVPKNYGVGPDAANKYIASLEAVNSSDCGPVDINVPVSDGWFPYNGLQSQGNLDEAKNHDPAIAVNTPADNTSATGDVRDLKFVPLAEGDTNYNLTCNKFTQVVDFSGLNMAWTNRVSKNSSSPYDTPNYFYASSSSASSYSGGGPLSIIGYGRNRESVPFGAAVLPTNIDIFGSSAIKFRDQFSQKASETIFAGRPYGCLGEGCNKIGYCSGDPNVFCFYGDDYLNKRSCYGGAYGECLDLWTGTNGYPKGSTAVDPYKDFKNILKSLFVKSFTSYTLTATSSGYTVDTSSVWDFSATSSVPTGVPICADNNKSRTLAPKFCANLPLISNVMLYYTNDNLKALNSTGQMTISKAGMYLLQFNSWIDPEQQPLREIYIDWGDGTKQTINDQDSRPAPGLTHSIYHYYSTTIAAASKELLITVYDNWNRYRSLGTPVIIKQEAIGNVDALSTQLKTD